MPAPLPAVYRQRLTGTGWIGAGLLAVAPLLAVFLWAAAPGAGPPWLSLFLGHLGLVAGGILVLTGREHAIWPPPPQPGPETAWEEDEKL